MLARGTGPKLYRGRTEMNLMFVSLLGRVDCQANLWQAWCTFFEPLHIYTHLFLLVSMHTCIIPYSVREHTCELSPSTVVNNWVSYLSCWICRAESSQSPGTSLLNGAQMNHASKPNMTCLHLVFVAGGRLSFSAHEWGHKNLNGDKCVFDCAQGVCGCVWDYKFMKCASVQNTTEDLCVCVHMQCVT